ncbi:TonB-dependent receptor [Aquimarina agarilytica]|uniref:TonB-dependent receptor n=1 Tax=Aquimarina agarilytica TaxID=1087449 RepID=UPI0002883D9B|nr:TonB-dependent receptor [Aquimarina agarilytica]
MKRYLLFFLLLGTTVANAQKRYTISGSISEKETGEKLFGVNVLASTTQGTITNDYGFYSITLPEGVYKLKINYLGFKDIELELNLDKHMKLDFELEESLDQLKEVVISSNSTSKAVTSTEMSVSVLSAKTIKKLPMVLGEPDLLKSIQLLPGVSSVNEASSGFNVRGGSSDQNLILLDEATIYNASHLFGFFSVFNTSAVKDMKLYKGGIPSVYGGRLSSVLDIKQKEGNKKKFGGTLGLGLISSKALIEGPI